MPKVKMSDMNIKRIKDYTQIYQTLLEMNDTYNPPMLSKIHSVSDYAKKLTENAYVFVAKDNKTLGFIAFYANDSKSNTVYISQISVKNDEQSRGIGKKLIEISYHIGKENKMEVVKLEVNKNNEKAIRFYKNEGFSRIDNHSLDTFYMQKILKE